MSNIYGEDRETQVIGGGYGGGVGAIILLIVAVAVLWFLSGGNRGHGDYGHGGGYPMAYGGGCGPCVQPTFKDESNWEEESHLKDKLCLIDRDVIEQGCKDREAIHCDGDKTREYIAHLSERADDKAYSALMMQNMQKDNYIQTLQLMGDFNGKLNCLAGEVEKGFCKTDSIIERLACETPKRPPFYACGGEPTVYDYPPKQNYNQGYDNYPRRGRCNSGCDDGYGYGA